MARLAAFVASRPGTSSSSPSGCWCQLPLPLSSSSWRPSAQLQQARNSSLLSYEEVTAGSPTPEQPTARPGRTLLVLHGLLGCGRNWRSWCRRLVEGAAAVSPPEGGPWRAVLVDLRGHGGSARRPRLHPPHNLEAAAEDVSTLIRHVMGSQRPAAVLGHSLGGKVALALMQQAAAHHHLHHDLYHHQHRLENTGKQRPQQWPRRLLSVESVSASSSSSSSSSNWCAPPRQLWVLDSQPGRVTAEQDAGTGVSRVLHTVNSVPLPIRSRAWLLRHLRESGLSEALATWLASNLVPYTAPPAHTAAPASAAGPQHKQPASSPAPPRGDAPEARIHHHHHHHHHGSTAAATASGSGGSGPLTWSFDIQCAGAMYMSYRTSDYWQVLENPPYGTAVHLVQGARSDRWPEAMQRRLAQAAAAAAAATAGNPAWAASGGGGGRFEHHVLERAGHWLHVDNPEGLMQLVLPRLAVL